MGLSLHFTTVLSTAITEYTYGSVAVELLPQPHLSFSPFVTLNFETGRESFLKYLKVFLREA